MCRVLQVGCMLLPLLIKHPITTAPVGARLLQLMPCREKQNAQHWLFAF